LTFAIDIVDRTPDNARPGALAFALPLEGVHLTVFYDRIVGRYKYRPDAVLAHVLVHEITHLLQGIARHSATGVMKPGFSPSDAYAMTYKPLPFTDEDLLLIRAGVARRLGTPVQLASLAAEAR
jgi:hypothetical protein